MKCVVLVLLALVACDKLPARPDEAKFKAMDDFEKCRATASRAIMCTDELMVAEVRSIAAFDGSDAFSDDLAEKLASEPPKSQHAERKANIQIHKTSCAGDREGSYVNGVFRCWAIEDCKKFAACVYETPAATTPPTTTTTPTTAPAP